MNALPEGFSVRAPVWNDADAVADLISACILVDGGEDSATTEEVLDDWEDVDLATEAVVVFAPDGRVAGYADVVNIAHVVVSVYGYVHPEYRGRGVGAYLVGWGEGWMRARIPQAPEDARVVVQHYVSASRSEEHTSELQSRQYLVCRLLLEKKLDLATAVLLGGAEPLPAQRGAELGLARGLAADLPDLLVGLATEVVVGDLDLLRRRLLHEQLGVDHLGEDGRV